MWWGQRRKGMLRPAWWQTQWWSKWWGLQCTSRKIATLMHAIVQKAWFFQKLRQEFSEHIAVDIFPFLKTSMLQQVYFRNSLASPDMCLYMFWLNNIKKDTVTGLKTTPVCASENEKKEIVFSIFNKTEHFFQIQVGLAMLEDVMFRPW